MSRSRFIEMLDLYASEGRKALFWLRDDDAIEPSAPLSHLLDLSTGWDAPMTLAAIPAHTGDALAECVSRAPQISVAVHGWDHVSHAPAMEKKQELGLHRGEDVVLAQLTQALERINTLFGDRAVPLLVPPWNRIAPALVDHLPRLGYQALSVFGPERGNAPLPLVNTHVDIIDWKGTRGGRDPGLLYAEAAAKLQVEHGPQTRLGVLTHHLVHDEAAWRFLEDLFEVTANHPACRWVPVGELIGRP
jgi:hypothetical protein